MVRIHSHDYQEQANEVTQKDPGAWKGQKRQHPTHYDLKLMKKSASNKQIFFYVLPCLTEAG